MLQRVPGPLMVLAIAGALTTPDDGEVTIGGIATSQLPDSERTRMRRTELGFVYQFHHLLPEFSARENVVLPQLVAGKTTEEARARAEARMDAARLTAIAAAL